MLIVKKKKLLTPLLKVALNTLILVACLHPLQGQPTDADWKRHRFFFDSLVHADIDQAKQLLDSLDIVSKSAPSSKTTFYTLYDHAYYDFVNHQMQASQEGFTLAMNLATDQGWEKEAIDSKIWVANHYYFNGEPDLAEKLYAEVIDESRALGYIDGMANGYYGNASILVDQEQILLQLLKVDSLYQAHNRVSAILSNSYGAIGDIYFRSYNNREEARRYYDKALNVAVESSYLPGIINMQKLLADLAMGIKDYSQANEFYRSLQAQYIQLRDSISLAYLMLDQAELNLQTGAYQRCEEQLLNALDLCHQFADTTAIGNTHLMLAKLYTATKRPEQVRQQLNNASQYPNKLDPNGQIIKQLALEVAYYQLIDSFEKAYYLQKELDSLQDLQLAQQNGKAFLELEQRYRAKEREQDIALLTTQNRLIAQRSQNQKVLFIGGGLILFLALLSLWVLYRNKQKTNERLRDLDRMKSNFLANISHEFRTPLTLISVPIEDRLQEENLSADDQKVFGMIKRNQTRLLNLVDQLLDLSKIDSGSLTLNLCSDNLMRFIKVLSEPFSYLAQREDQIFVVQVTDNQQLYWYDADAVEKIVINLLSNAFKYTNPGGTVKLNALVRDRWLYLEVANEGPALTDHQKQRIFDKFYQIDEDQPGTGIGLALVKELVTLHDGNIEVSNHPPGWVSFKVSLAVNKEYYHSKAKVVINDQQIEPKDSEPRDQPLAIRDSEQPLMLIVEDHPDVQQLLESTFRHQYQVICASNGLEGKQLALHHIPDIIISDVMMPMMDGQELTTEIKKDERTSHIPIILLTAKAGEEHHVKGLEVGADDYITKPFSSKLLRAKVSALVAQRQQLISKYRQELILQPQDVGLTSTEEQFLNKLQTVLDEHLSNPDFNVEIFSDALAMSRMQLHRKLKALTGQSASEFIRTQRLKAAAELLKTSKANISEICYAVGFNDPSYFARCFRDEFNVTPTEYAAENAVS